LRRFGRPDANALQFEHAGLRFRASRRRETADFAACGQHPVTRNDQRRGISGHRLADVSRRFAARANLLRQGAISGRAAPANPAQSVVNLGEERVLAPEIELNLREVRFLAGKVPFRGLDDRRNICGRRGRLRADSAATHQPFRRFGGFRRQLKTRDARIAPGDRAKAHRRLKDLIPRRGSAGCRFCFGHESKMRHQASNSTRFLSPHSNFVPHPPGRIISLSALRIAVLGTPNSPP
jgi:hypothetical protein